MLIILYNSSYNKNINIINICMIIREKHFPLKLKGKVKSGERHFTKQYYSEHKLFPAQVG